MIRRWAVVSVTALSVGALALGASPLAQPAEQGPKPVATATRAMVSSSHPDVTRAMLDVLRKGGNAVDAMVAGVILQPVIEPQMSTLAGGIGALVYEARSGRLYYLDAELDHTSRDAPIGADFGAPGSVAETSGRRVGVPGTVAGLHAAATRFGTWKWADYFAPAIRTAEQGFPMYSFLYADMADAALGRLAAYPSGREEFLPGGFVPPVGTTVKRPKLAATLKRLAAEGPDYFYKGDWARRLVEEVNRTGGRITLDDLAGYEARWSEPVRFTYRGIELASSPPPATGGTLIAMVLNMLERFDVATMPHFSASSRSLAMMRQIFALAESHSDTFVRDPRSADVPLDVLLSKDFAATLSRLIDGSWPKAALPRPAEQAYPAHDPHYSDTNHIVVVDEQGNWVSATHTVYGSTFATGLVVDGIGVNSGNGFPGTGSGQGRRVVAPFPPTMVLRDGKPWMAIGSPGLASRAVALVLSNVLGFKMGLYEAVDAPRFQGSLPGQRFQVESRVPQAVRDELAAYGITVEPTAPYNWHMGSVHAVMRDADGRLVGVADPRRAGHAEGY